MTHELSSASDEGKEMKEKAEEDLRSFKTLIKLAHLNYFYAIKHQIYHKSKNNIYLVQFLLSQIKRNVLRPNTDRLSYWMIIARDIKYKPKSTK